MGIPLRLLMIEDSEDDAALVLRELKRGGYDVVHKRVDTSAAMISAVDSQEWDLVISDHSMPHFTGMDALHVLRSKGSIVPFIFVSGTIGEETAVSALKDGAQDYLMKTNLKRLVPAIQRELREREASRERISLERQLVQSQKMEAIGRLAGGIAHDFNNMLGVIIGYSDLILDQPGHDQSIRKQVGEIKRAGERAASLTRQLLAFSRHQVLEPKVLSLNTIVVEMERMLRRLIGEDIDLQTCLQPDLGSVKADSGHIEQVLLNLAVNARDAMAKGGKLIIETSNIDIDEVHARLCPPMLPGRFVMLAVTDTGIGMNAETQTHIFEPFFTTKEVGKGTGLGLATVYGIVKQSGGFVWVKSEPGQGASFHIYLPFVDEIVESKNETPQVADYRGTETILLVEDAAPLRELANTILSECGYSVLYAENGEEALNIANQHTGHIHLMLTDIIMPVMGGRELRERLKSLRPAMRVLYMSGYTDTTTVAFGSNEEDEVSILHKPFTKKDLLQKLRHELDRGSFGQSSKPGSKQKLLLQW